MRKIFVLFKREYLVAVKTKSFIISIILVPILMGGSLITIVIMENNKDTDDKKFAIIDNSGLFQEGIEQAAETRNKEQIFDAESGEKTSPAYVVEFLEADKDDPAAQRLAISERIRQKELHALIEIGENILNPGPEFENAHLRYYSEHGFNDDARWWFQGIVNDQLRQLRVAELDLAPEVVANLFLWSEIESMGLAGVDKKTGESMEAERTNEIQSFIVPYVMVILMFMLTLMSAIPLLTAVMEEKSEKIAEVLLGSVTPFQFMAGKVLGGIGVGLTVAAVYIAGAMVTLTQMDAADLIPSGILAWFFVYLFFYIIMVGSGMAALGATCNDNKDAQSLQFPAMFPVIFPMFVIFPLISNPTGAFATTIALIPPFTPTVMLVRMATPVTIPLWQPIIGLVGVILFTIFSIWIGARIFRTAILIQGQKPTFGNLFKYAFRK